MSVLTRRPEGKRDKTYLKGAKIPFKGHSPFHIVETEHQAKGEGKKRGRGKGGGER